MEERTGRGLGPESASPASLPSGVALADGLTEDEAVAIALWNNADLQVALTQLGFARADLLEAGMLRNPILSLLFPIGPKQLEATATFPVEALWQRPRRVAVARLNAQRVAEMLVQHGLDLVRDVRMAHADVVLAGRRATLTAESYRTRQRIAEITEARLRAGDISEMEANSARADASVAGEETSRAGREVQAVKSRLAFLLGLPGDSEFEVLMPAEEVAPPGDLPGLKKRALAARPDLRAAELSLETAGARAGWERSRIANLSAVLDINAEGKNGFEAGPGIAAEIPLLNTNPGGRARAQAELERASKQYAAISQRISLEVDQAYIALQQARASYAAWHDEILPKLEGAVRQAEKAYEGGDVSYLFVLEATRRQQEAALRKEEAAAAARRASAELDRSIGSKR